ncbi:hypothetical protein PC128_g16303 [Phytophthora cactorum]|nr:hypothetical protein PC128_g16303 [Phytophthora cactorum]
MQGHRSQNCWRRRRILLLAEMQTTTKPREATPPHKEPGKKIKIIDHQRNVIGQLMEHIKRQGERMDSLEAKMDGNRARARSISRNQVKNKISPSADEGQ